MHHAYSSNNINSNRGLTLIELLVTLVIISILAAAALPYAEMTIRREKELELRGALREIRTAIDRFHEDWRTGKIPKSVKGASEDGYPLTLMVLVEGIDIGDSKGGTHKYLRQVPRDPFAQADILTASQWLARSYRDDYDSEIWSGEDVYDVRSGSQKVAIDGTYYKDW